MGAAVVRGVTGRLELFGESVWVRRAGAGWRGLKVWRGGHAAGEEVFGAAIERGDGAWLAGASGARDSVGEDSCRRGGGLARGRRRRRGWNTGAGNWWGLQL